jgi:hypothetical protein
LGGIECNQEARHRQTLLPQEFIEFLETKIRDCVALLLNFIPGFELQYTDHYLHKYKIDTGLSLVSQSFSYDHLYHQSEASRAAPPADPGLAVRALADTGIGYEERLGLKYSSQPIAGSSGDGSRGRSPTPEPRDYVYYTMVEHLQAPPPKDPPPRDSRKDDRVPGSATPDPLPYDVSLRQGLLRAFTVSRTLANSLTPGNQC